MTKKGIRGFSLLELGVVVICIGILSTVFLYGKSLIVASKVNKEVADLLSYKNAFSAFSEKYACLPGDCNRASSFLDIPECESEIGAGSCNGDGNGKYDKWGWGEDVMRFWPHLELSGYLKKGDRTGGEPSYRTSTYNSTSTHYVIYGMMSGGVGPAPYGTIPNINVLVFSGMVPGVGAYGPVLSPLSTESLDRKMDDGSPNTGGVMAYQGQNIGSIVTVGNCLSGTSYNIANDGTSCYITIRLGE